MTLVGPPAQLLVEPDLPENAAASGSAWLRSAATTSLMLGGGRRHRQTAARPYINSMNHFGCAGLVRRCRRQCTIALAWAGSFKGRSAVCPVPYHRCRSCFPIPRDRGGFKSESAPTSVFLPMCRKANHSSRALRARRADRLITLTSFRADAGKRGLEPARTALIGP